MSSNSLLPLLYSTINSEAKMPAALDLLSSDINCRGLLISSFNNVGFQYSSLFSNTIYRNRDKEIKYFSDLYNSTELIAWRKILSSPIGKPLTDFQMWSCGHEIKNREDVQYLIENLGVYRRAAMNLSPEVGWSAGIIFQYDASIEEIPANSLKKAASFTPHLFTIIETHRFINRLKRNYRAVYSVLDRIRIGVFVTDYAGNIVVGNRSAQVALDEKDGLSLQGGKIVCSDPDDTTRVALAITQMSLTSRGEGSHSQVNLPVVRPSGKQPYLLSILPLKDGSSEIEENFTGVLIFVFDTDKPPSIDISPLVALAALTSAEAAVTALILRGHTDREISNIRGVSHETVRSQVKSILIKTGASNRAVLVRQAAVIAPPVD